MVASTMSRVSVTSIFGLLLCLRETQYPRLLLVLFVKEYNHWCCRMLWLYKNLYSRVLSNMNDFMLIYTFCAFFNYFLCLSWIHHLAQVRHIGKATGSGLQSAARPDRRQPVRRERGTILKKRY
jgi:hypothetical protein